MMKLLDKIVLFVSSIAMLGLLGAYTASYVNPNNFVWPSLLGLAYPYLLIANIILLLYWITRWKKAAFAVLIVILLGIPSFMTYYGTASDNEQEKDSDISLLSYNIRYFDVYKWSNQEDTKEKLFNYLNHFKGDVICLQEFSTNDNSSFQKTIIYNLKSFPYYHIYKDMAIFSQIPFIRKGNIFFDPQYSSSCIYCDIPLCGDTVRIYSVHLESYKLGKKERQFMKDISQGVKSNNIPEKVKNLTKRLTTANKNRALQAEQIKRHLQKSPYQVVLCGDFNDTPLSYTYKKLKGELEDSFIEKGRGLGNTYIGEFPSFRIDYILHTPNLETVSYSRNHIQLSDHYPITSKLRMKNRK
ncbi:MAG: endonuclease/exonuclease/phosphatase family protein [Odoribacter sp.]